MKPTFIALLMFSLCLSVLAQGKPKQLPKDIPSLTPLPKDIPSLKALAEKGDARAQFEIGNKYTLGAGVEEDDQEAFKWFRKAAEQNHPEAQWQLGQMYYSGVGVGKNYKEVVKWYRKAAEQNLPKAQCVLGLMYQKGEGVERDYVKAYAWVSTANDHYLGYLGARNIKNSYDRFMTPEQIARGKALSKKLRQEIEAKNKSLSKGQPTIIEKAIRRAAKKPSGTLTEADYQKMTRLNFFRRKLTNVKGLEKLTQLTELHLTSNQLTDVKGLEKLTRLTMLQLQNNPDLTKAQIAELQKALPKCKIYSNPKK